MCSGGSGCVATCFGFCLIVGFVEGSATRCDWPSAPRVAARTQRRKNKRKEKVSHALFCFSPPPDKQQQGGGGRWGREGGHQRVARSLHLRQLQHSQTRRSSSGRTAASKPEKKRKKCFCKTIQEKKSKVVSERKVK